MKRINCDIAFCVIKHFPIFSIGTVYLSSLEHKYLHVCILFAGKFQMQVLPQCGHAVHEDVPDKVAEVLATFMVRHKFAEPESSFERSVLYWRSE
jgi:hypothetical protein